MDAALARGFAYAGHMTIRPAPLGLSAARRQVLSLAHDLGLDEDDRTDILLAVGEALSNAYRHGTVDPDASFIYLGWHFADEVLTVTVKDEGPGFAPFEVLVSDDDLRNARGCGIRLMRQSVDEVYFEWDDGAVVVLKKRLARRRGERQTPGRS